MAWEKQINQEFRYVHWVDIPAATAWIVQANELTSDEAIARLDREPWQTQANATRSMWFACAQVYRALNLPALSDPIYQDLFQEQFGPSTMEDCTNRQMLGARTALLPSGREGLANVRVQGVGDQQAMMLREGIALYNRVFPNPSGEQRWFSAPIRIYLDQYSIVRTNCLNERDGLGGEGECFFWPGIAHYNTCLNTSPESNNPSCDRYNWSTMAAHDPPRQVGGVEDDRRGIRLLLPLRWFALLAQRLARSLRERGAQDVLNQSRTFVTAMNLALARAYTPSGTPNELYELAEQVPSNLFRSRFSNPQMRSAAQAMMYTASALAAVPVFGPVVSAITSGLALLMQAVPAATGFATDGFCRPLPTYEKAWLSGNATLDAPPDFSVQTPADMTAQALRETQRSVQQTIAQTRAQNPINIPNVTRGRDFTVTTALRNDPNQQRFQEQLQQAQQDAERIVEPMDQQVQQQTSDSQVSLAPQGLPRWVAPVAVGAGAVAVGGLAYWWMNRKRG